MKPTENTALIGDGFHILSFAIDGQLEGDGRWRYDMLSSSWLAICEQIVHDNEGNFHHVWSGPLSHLRAKMTSAMGAALCTFFVRDRVASSILTLSGTFPKSEEDLSRLFIQSLMTLPLIRASASSSQSFSGILSSSHRPLMAVVPFPDPSISDEDHNLVRELSLHLAAAFLRSQDKVAGEAA